MAIRRIDWIELVTGFACNCRCVVCPSAYRTDPAALSFEEMSGALREGRRLGAHGAWFGGGEPTLHPELPRAVVLARRIGYRTVRLQTNGLRLAYAEYARKLTDLGVDRFSFLVLGHRAGVHDGISRLPGAFDLLTRAIDNLAGRDVRLEADVLMTNPSVDHLSETVRVLSERGIGEITFWLVSMHGLEGVPASDWVPPLSRLADNLRAAFDRADEKGVKATTLHLPPCALGEKHRSRYFHSGRWNLRVVVPNGEPFMAEDSPMEGGVFLDGCERCSQRADCLGLRADYLELHGSAGFEPIDS
jgi:MoaA/NifB/PqqE/SkfB family radical SAM enzyme